MTSGRYDINVEQGSDYKLFLEYQDANENAVDLTGYEGKFEVRKPESLTPVVTVGITASGGINDESFSQGVTLEALEFKFGNASMKAGGPFSVGSGLYPTGGHYLVTGLDHVTYNSDDVYNISFFIKLNPNTVDSTRRRIITTKDWTAVIYSFINLGQSTSNLLLYWRADDGTIESANVAGINRIGSDAFFDGDYLFMQFRGGGGKNVSARLTANGFNYDANVSGDFPDFIGDDGTIYLGGRTTNPIPTGFGGDPNVGGTADDFSLNLDTNFISDSSFRGNYDAFQIRNLGSSPANDGFIDPPTTAPSSGVTFNNFDVAGSTFDPSYVQLGTADISSNVFEQSFGLSGGLLLNKDINASGHTGGIAIKFDETLISAIDSRRHFYNLKLTDTDKKIERIIEGRFDVNK